MGIDPVFEGLEYGCQMGVKPGVGPCVGVPPFLTSSPVCRITDSTRLYVLIRSVPTPGRGPKVCSTSGNL